MDQNPETPRLWPRDHDNGVRFPHKRRWDLINLWCSINLPYLIYLHLFTFFTGLFVLTLGLCIACLAIPLARFLWRMIWLFRGWIFIQIMMSTCTTLTVLGATKLAEWGRNDLDEGGH
ncbi:hypothetical protein E6O75_ATG10821 [Venturia nashicola]|uniref:Uncharacterized protein n=1 Tax=Venturia nashicola TaxID=86259 RepID=A0A4Z1P0Q0_9PEZI|nr:hypothetical protein E6O75_ATG10821 [Venturia nashicola]